MQEIMDTLKEADNEGTACPYWLILDPIQNMACSVDYLAHQITGPFFSREDAKDHMECRRHAFSSRAVVYCHSGHASYKYKALCRKLKI